MKKKLLLLLVSFIAFYSLIHLSRHIGDLAHGRFDGGSFGGDAAVHTNFAGPGNFTGGKIIKTDVGQVTHGLSTLGKI